MQEDKNIKNENGAILTFSSEDNTNCVISIQNDPQTIEQNYNTMMLVAMQGMKPFERYTLLPGMFSFKRYNLPLSNELFNCKDALKFYKYFNENKPDDKKDLYDRMVQYDRGNRELTGQDIENRIKIIAVETDKGVLLFGDEAPEKNELRNYLKYLGDNFFYPELAGTNTVKLFSAVTDNPKLMSWAQDSWEYPPFSGIENNPDRVKINQIDYSKYPQMNPSILCDADFIRTAQYNLNGDFETCLKFHGDFKLEISDKNQKICALSEVAEYGFDCSKGLLENLSDNKKEIYIEVKKIIDDTIRNLLSGKNPEVTAQRMNDNLCKYAQQMLDRDFPDRQKMEPQKQEQSKGLTVC